MVALIVLEGPSDEWVGVLLADLALLVSLLPLLRPPAEQPLDQVVDALANDVRKQWLEEATFRRLRDPGVLPLTWSATRRQGIGSDPIEVIRVQSDLRVTRVPLSGRLEGDFDQAIQQLATDYRRIASGRMVLLGEPGAGKSVLAALLTLGLLAERTAEDRTPVLLAASSWDPVVEPLGDWIIRMLALIYYNGQRETPTRLLRAGLVLPVIDGLDEVPEAARRAAVGRMNQALNEARTDATGNPAVGPLVVTSRSAEYSDIIKAGSPILHEAPVVEIAPLAMRDVFKYFEDVRWPAGTSWRRLRQELDHAIDENGKHCQSELTCAVCTLAATLSTPLMVSMARQAYERLGGDPAELLNGNEFGSRHRVEDFLTDRFIDAAYGSMPPPVPGSPRTPWKPPTAQHARSWLVYLSRYLHQHRDRDLAWWQLSQRQLSAWVAPGVSIIAGLVVVATGVLSGLLLGAANTGDVGWLLAEMSYVGVAFTLLSLIIWYAAPVRPPGRLSLSTRGSLGRLRAGFLTGSAVASIPGAVTLVAAGAILAYDGWSVSEVSYFCQVVLTVLALILVVGLALAVNRWLDAPPEHSAQAGPQLFLRQDRRSSLVGAAVTGIVVGLLAFPLVVLAGKLAPLVGQAIVRDPAWPVGWDRAVRANDSATDPGWSDVRDPAAAATAVLVPAVSFAILILQTRAWPRFAAARFVLAARGRLPWRLMRFLADARDRGLLRQSGGVYQFRHVRLQERLATLPASPARHLGRTAEQVRTGPRAISTAAAAVLGIIAVGIVVYVAPKTPAREAFIGPQVRYENLVLSAGGRRLAASAGRTVNVWESGSSELTAKHVVAKTIDAIALSPDGERLALATDDVILLLDASRETAPIAQRRIAGARAINFANESGALTVITHDTVIVWDERLRNIICAAPLRNELMRGNYATLNGYRQDMSIAIFSYPGLREYGNDGEMGFTSIHYDCALKKFSPLRALLSPDSTNVDYAFYDNDYGRGAISDDSELTTLALIEGSYVYVWYLSTQATVGNDPKPKPEEVDIGRMFGKVDDLALSPDGRAIGVTFAGIIYVYEVPAHAN
jgi:hypothetical protein